MSSIILHLSWVVPKASTRVALSGIQPSGPVGLPKLKLPTMAKKRGLRITRLWGAFSIPECKWMTEWMNERIKPLLSFNIWIFLILKLDYRPHHEAGLDIFNLRLTEIRQAFGFLCDLLSPAPRPYKIWWENCHMLGF